ncbi:hypothetical protein ACLB2K_076527 [Fragaria x ananassa]
MDFCPDCGGMLQYELPNMHAARFFCPTCPYVAYMENRGEIRRREALVKKEIQPIINLNDFTNAPKTEETCPACGHKEAAFREQQTRSADEASTKFYRCLNDDCKHAWIDYS